MTTTIETTVHDEATMLIAGQWRRSASRYEVTDPGTGQTVGWADDAGPDEAREAVTAAAAAAPHWRRTAPEQRSAMLRAAAGQIRAGVDDLALLLSRESGKPLTEARGELASAAAATEWAAEQGRRADGRLIDLGGDRRGMVLRQPVGVTVAISPWNFPASMLVRKVALALAAGCTVVAKPAEQTPLIGRALVACFEAAGCPGGALNLVTTLNPEAVVRSMLEDPRVAKLSFTGSSEVGRSLLARGEGRLKRVALELGGHAPALVLEDTDLDEAVPKIVASKFRNAGQSCIAVNRVYVPEKLAEAFESRLLSEIGDLVVGPGTVPGSEVGPLIDETALNRLERQVGDALEKGAKALTGAERESSEGCADGWFYRPTVLSGVTDTMAVASEETFGPVLTLHSYGDLDDAVAQANATDYGLAAYVYGSDLRTAWRTAERLEFGVVGINDPFPLAPELPFGGMKNSGLGREGGLEGVDGFVETKAVALHV